MRVSGPVYSPVRLRPANDPSVTNEKESGWALKPVWMCWRTEKYIAPTGIQTTIFSVVNPVVRSLYPVVVQTQIVEIWGVK